MLKSCRYCGRIHDSKYDCGKKPKPKWTKVANEKDKFRSSHAWTIKRNEIVARDQYLCQWCKTEGQYTHEHLEVHHIVPLEEDYELRLDNDNLITLCEWHHEWAERGQIERSALITIAQR